MSKKEKLQLVRSPILESFSGLTHAFTTRMGGVSSPPYNSLNLSAKSGDKESAVNKNRQILADSLSIKKDFFILNQVHGDNIVVAEDIESPETVCDADAVITAKPKMPLAILTADCLSILLYSTGNKSIGAVHAGWKGTALNIAGKTVKKMIERFEEKPENIYAAMGPAIGPCCYEVDYTVYEQFQHSSNLWNRGSVRIERDGDSRWMLDLLSINTDQLIETGLKPANISRTTSCTACNEKLFYSYRRDGKLSGRHGAIIMIA